LVSKAKKINFCFIYVYELMIYRLMKCRLMKYGLRKYGDEGNRSSAYFCGDDVPSHLLELQEHDSSAGRTCARPNLYQHRVAIIKIEGS